MGQVKENEMSSDAELVRAARAGDTFYREGRISRMRRHLAPRPRSGGCWEVAVLGPLAAEGD